MDGGMKAEVQQGPRQFPRQRSQRRSESDSNKFEVEPKDSDPCEESFVEDDISYGQSKASHVFSVGLSYGHSDTSTVKR